MQSSVGGNQARKAEEEMMARSLLPEEKIRSNISIGVETVGNFQPLSLSSLLPRDKELSNPVDSMRNKCGNRKHLTRGPGR